MTTHISKTNDGRPHAGVRSGTRRAAAGLSLIEVLIALLVLSIGLVGMASLQLTSLKSAHSSYYRSLASTVALNIEERVWQEAREILDEPGECITDATLNTVRDNIEDDWGPSDTPSNTGWDWTNEDLAVIPNLNVAFGTLGTDSVERVDNSNNGTWTDAWRQIPVKLTWIENRLGETATNEAGDFVESFDYTIRVPCVPEFAVTTP